LSPGARLYFREIEEMKLAEFRGSLVDSFFDIT